MSTWTPGYWWSVSKLCRSATAWWSASLVNDQGIHQGVDQRIRHPDRCCSSLCHLLVSSGPGGCPVAGQDHGAGLVALADQLEEVVAALGSELAQAEVVQDQQVEPGQLADPGLPGVVGVAAGQLGQQPAGLGEADRMPLAAGGMPQ